MPVISHVAKLSGRLAKQATILSLVAALTLPASAQTVDDNTVPEAGLNVPEGLTIFGEQDPNVRRATAIVNGEIITGTDVDQRVALILAANEAPVSEEEEGRLRLQVLRNLIDETLQIQEAAGNDITVEEAQVERTYAQVATQNFRRDTSALDTYLASIGSSPRSLKRQIRGELAWQRLLGRNVTPFINVSEEEVKEVIERLQAAKGTEEYRIGEIYLSANSQNRTEVAANAQRIVQQLQQGGSFVGYARQFSEASTAAVGGDLGWIQLGVLPASMVAVARDMQVGQLAGPIEIPGGFTIMYLIDKRQVLTANPRDALMSLKQLSLAFPPGITEGEATRRASEFATATRGIRGCGAADSVAAQLGATVTNNDQVPVRELPAPLQDTLLALSIGEATQPFGSVTEGVRVLVLCGRDDPQAEGGPNPEQLMASMEDEKVNRRAQIYLRDLRRDAVIEYN
ncbi:peptidylprolyl isomerase [Blastomonas sp.]|uniref:peptidylprolyl isomerase n=1 Tax=Blastomonas sp. TaxID=1909299 RepID=UPI003593C348